MNECQDDLALAVELLCILIQHNRIDDTDLNVLLSYCLISISFMRAFKVSETKTHNN